MVDRLRQCIPDASPLPPNLDSVEDPWYPSLGLEGSICLGAEVKTEGSNHYLVVRAGLDPASQQRLEDAMPSKELNNEPLAMIIPTVQVCESLGKQNRDRLAALACTAMNLQPVGGDDLNFDFSVPPQVHWSCLAGVHAPPAELQWMEFPYTREGEGEGKSAKFTKTKSATLLPEIRPVVNTPLFSMFTSAEEDKGVLLYECGRLPGEGVGFIEDTAGVDAIVRVHRSTPMVERLKREAFGGVPCVWTRTKEKCKPTKKFHAHFNSVLGAAPLQEVPHVIDDCPHFIAIQRPNAL